MLLAIVSKMFKDGLLNKMQRGENIYFVFTIWNTIGALKDLIIDNDLRVLGALQKYENDGDQNCLYQTFINIAAA